MRQQRPEAHSVYLGSKSYEVFVPPQVYQQIIAIAQAAALCSDCREPYSEANPNVAMMLCLRCFLRADRHGLTFQGVLDENLDTEQRYHSPYEPYKGVIYLFLNNKGHAYTTRSGPGQSDEARTESRITLKYWNFPWPTQAEHKGETINVSGCHWYIYGDVRTDEALIIQHGSQWSKDEILFLVNRHGSAIQINRRKAAHRQMLSEAKAELEATRKGDKFLIDGELQSQIHEGDVYRRAAKRVGEALATRRVAAEQAKQPPLIEEAEEAQPA